MRYNSPTMLPFPTHNVITHLLITLFLLLTSSNIYADDANTINTDNNYAAIGEHVEYLIETDQPLSLQQVQSAYTSGVFQQWHKPVLSFGIGSSPVWVRFNVSNNGSDKVQRLLVIENSWMDYIDIFILENGQTVFQEKTGDHLPYSEKTIKHRFFVFEHDYEPGISEVYLRLATPDPMVLPIFFGSKDSSAERDVFNGYSYGLLYGIAIALMLYNLLLYISIRQTRYFYYVAYLLMFLLTNLSYTGHAYGLFWPDSVWLQKWMNPISISLFSTSGVLFAFSFLKIRLFHPALYKNTLIVCTLIWLLQIILMAMGKQNASVIIAIFFVGFFSIFTFYAAIISLKRGHNDAIYYLIATMATLIGAAITSMTVWSIIPYSTLTFRAAEISISIDALLLSIALAEYIRRMQKEKTQAQQLARTDMLTSLNNRRAFNEISTPIWHNATRHQQELCVILLDIDKFKNINDTYGHAAGDQVLKQVASALNNVIREGDVLARWGGEEFAIMLPQTSLDQALNMAERIRSNISDLQILNENTVIKTTVSIGVAQKDNNTESIDKLFTVADAGLYLAKQNGRNKVCTA